MSNPDEKTAAERARKDGFPARIKRSLAVGGLAVVVGRKRAIRDRSLEEEELEILPLNERGEVVVSEGIETRRLLVEISEKLDKVIEVLGELR